MRNNRHWKFAERGHEIHRPVKKNNTNTTVNAMSLEKTTTNNCPPWEGNHSKYKTPHFRHPDLSSGTKNTTATTTSSEASYPPKGCRALKQPAGLGLSTGDRVVVWTDPDTGRISTLNTRPPHYVQREVVVVASFYEYPPPSDDGQWLGGEWSPIVYIPFPSEGAARLSVSEFNDSMGAAGEPISGLISHADMELLSLLKAKDSDPRFRILWSKLAFKFVAATKPPLLSRPAKQPSWRSLDKSRKDRSYTESGEENTSDEQVVKGYQNQYSASPIEVSEEDIVQHPMMHAPHRPVSKLTRNKRSWIADSALNEVEEPYTVSKVKPSPLKLTPNSLVHHIFSMLMRHKRPLHIDEMINKLEEKNLLQNYGYHKYSSVYSAISKHYELFDKSGKATFSIREAFKFKPQKQQTAINTPLTTAKQSAPKAKTLNKTVKSLTQMVIDVAKEIRGSDSAEVYPGAVYQFLGAMGYSVSYSSVHRIMQNKKHFNRKGFCYHLQQGKAK